MEYNKINYEFIEAYCVEHKEAAWLKTMLATPIGDRKITFVELKIAFCKKFMPEVMPKAKPKKPSMFERAAML